MENSQYTDGYMQMLLEDKTEYKKRIAVEDLRLPLYAS
jgi:hypothetical protein